jgi:hypothetical protein
MLTLMIRLCSQQVAAVVVVFADLVHLSLRVAAGALHRQQQQQQGQVTAAGARAELDLEQGALDGRCMLRP